MSAALMALLAGCEDECTKGKSECVSDALIRTCVATDDGNTWLTHECGANEQCAKNGGALSGDAGVVAGDAAVESLTAALTTSSNASNVAACVGNCLENEHVCVSDALSKLCLAGGVWQLDACEVGEKCTDGVCQISSEPGAVQQCKPNDRACAGDKTEKICNPDGTAWTEQPCALNETCETKTGECAPDPKSSCDDLNGCIDSTHAARCLAEGKGFEVITCPDTTWCEGGLCQGKVCALGKTCNGPNQVRECLDGENFVDTQCGANEVCQQLKDTAECVKVNCTVGQTQCGDPRDEKVDATKFFTTCVNNAAGSAIPEWVKGECAGELSCNPLLVGTGTPCSQDCTPGAIRCAPFGATGVSSGTQECDKNGKWGAVKSCNAGTDLLSTCVTPPALAGELPKAVCAEPVCAFALVNPLVATGTCDNGKLVECLPDGTLAKAADCPTGLCVDSGPPADTDGRKPGICFDPGDCVDGEEICAGGNLFQTCINGVWSTKLTSCAKDALCTNTTDGLGLRKKVCGGDCAPGTRQCDPMDPKKVQTCGKDGKFAAGAKCDLGFCQASGSDASCVISCMPGTVRCAGAGALAADGFHTGTAQEEKCGSDGTYAAATACAAGTVCRTSDAGVVLGCIQCIGENVAGGNSENRVDTRCDPAAPLPADKLQICTAENKWGASTTCTGDTVCQGPSGLGCDTCTSADGLTVTCTNTLVNDAEVCGPCDIDGAGVSTAQAPTCTVASLTTSGGSTCEAAGLTAASLFAGVQCCGGGTHRSGTQSCTGLGYGAPVATGAAPDCCGFFTITASSSIAFCGAP